MHGTIHDLVSLVVFTSLPIAIIAFARAFARAGERGWAVGSVVAAVALIAGLVLFVGGLNGVRALAPVAGLVQRAWVVGGWGWLLAVAAHTLRRRDTIAASG